MPSPLTHRLRHHRPSVVLDIGANLERFGMELCASVYVGRPGSFDDVEMSEEGSVPCLDSLFPTLVGSAETVRLKVDTQKCEPAVLRGSGRVRERIDTVFLELSFIPLYDGVLPAEAVMK